MMGREGERRASRCPSQALCLPIMYTESNFVSLDEELRLDKRQCLSVCPPCIIFLVQVLCICGEIGVMGL